MTDIKKQLRDATQKLRRTPMPIADIAPLLSSAADHIDRQEALIAELRKDAERYRFLKVAMRDGNSQWYCHDIRDDLDIDIQVDTSTQEVG